jgi:hypothetical protein
VEGPDVNRTGAILLLSALISVFAVPAFIEMRNVRPVRDGGYWGHFLFDFVRRLFTKEEISYYEGQRFVALLIVFPATLLLVYALFGAYDFIGSSR